ncbi:MAG: tRNA preQ1(34) S-adenosylmethionine ribosyltransferase-isomerase QueA [Verrucomicrobia bacterium]|nr:tRNA preQ1(34) S-adenosylmethionine ribosyltransferase-isomerase QueA [Verrucomicrobiota bacterium]
MFTREFHYDLPPELIAQTPTYPRDACRLLVVHRQTRTWEHQHFPQITQWIQPGDVLVLNDSRVLPARLRGSKADTGGQFEILLLEEIEPMDWWVLLRPGKRVRPGTVLLFHNPQGSPSPLRATVQEKNSEGWCRLKFSGVADLFACLQEIGELPLPPYIDRSDPASRSDDEIQYQTVYAKKLGSIAAPTAGLHFSPEILTQLEQHGVELQKVTLHVGHGTFSPVKVDQVEDHLMHEERFEVSEEAATAIQRARSEGRRIIAVGTTTVRVLESVARQNDGRIVPGPGRTRIFLYPPAPFLVVGGLLTNFHLPESTLLMLVSAFAQPRRHPEGRDFILSAYQDAIRERYRFFSYGDAMLLL